ncbi:hypothetical protein COLO4_23305 [Corchorus olitorius]|uniref:Uncharacterized protein n=1 Tax=Corchorus olitorius TaxID=93759 RepID=A0A1R3IHL7_9ROSI|nr:hypothetical protein COLO4_23305 [Corchorus olitorius]
MVGQKKVKTYKTLKLNLWATNRDLQIELVN